MNDHAFRRWQKHMWNGTFSSTELQSVLVKNSGNDSRPWSSSKEWGMSRWSKMLSHARLPLAIVRAVVVDAVAVVVVVVLVDTMAQGGPSVASK